MKIKVFNQNRFFFNFEIWYKKYLRITYETRVINISKNSMKMPNNFDVFMQMHERPFFKESQFRRYFMDESLC